MIIGYTTGVFDLFHIGHLNNLRRAKEHCDYLIVGDSTDELVLREKHKNPIIPFSDRVEIVRACRKVDEVVPQINKNKLEAYMKLERRFHKMFVGSDWRGTAQWEQYEKDFEPYDVEIIYLPHTDGISTSILTSKIQK